MQLPTGYRQCDWAWCTVFVEGIYRPHHGWNMRVDADVFAQQLLIKLREWPEEAVRIPYSGTYTTRTSWEWRPLVSSVDISGSGNAFSAQLSSYLAVADSMERIRIFASQQAHIQGLWEETQPVLRSGTLRAKSEPGVWFLRTHQMDFV